MEAMLVLWITFAIGAVFGWWARVRWQIFKVRVYVLKHPELLRPFGGRYSEHDWGRGIDLNVPDNPYDQDDER